MNLVSFFCLLLLVSSTLAYSLDISASPSGFDYIGVYDVYGSGSTVQGLGTNAFNVTGSPTSIDFLATNSNCESCFYCGFTHWTALRSAQVSLSVQYSSTYVTVSGSVTKTNCNSNCLSANGNKVNIPFGFPQYYTLDFVTFSITPNIY